MTKVELGAYLMWEGELSKIVGMTDRLTVIIQPVNENVCPHCGERRQTHVVVDSPMFKDGAKPVNTIKI